METGGYRLRILSITSWPLHYASTLGFGFSFRPKVSIHFNIWFRWCKKNRPLPTGQHKCHYTLACKSAKCWPIFGQLFVKRFALCYRTVVLSCLSVMSVYCDQTVGRIKMKPGMQVGLVPGHMVLDGDRAPTQRSTAPKFSAHVYCGQTVAHLSSGWY